MEGDDTMSKKIITIGRQFGSGGHEIGERIAKKLDIPFYDDAILEAAAKELGIDLEDAKEIEEESVHNFVVGHVGMFSFDRSYRIEDINRSMSDQLYRAQSAFIKELAEQGPCVIVGRCADYVLRDRDDVLSVFICADDEYRIERLKRVRGMVRDYAESQIKVVDKRRRKYYEKYTSRGWDSQLNHHMVLNASLLGEDYIVDLLAEMCEK